MAKSHVKFVSEAHKAMVRPVLRGQRRKLKTTYEVFQAKANTKKGLSGKGHKKGLWYFHLVAGNGEIIAASEGYTRRFTAVQGAKRAVKMAALLAETTSLLEAAAKATSPAKKAAVRKQALRLRRKVTQPVKRVVKAAVRRL